MQLCIGVEHGAEALLWPCSSKTRGLFRPCTHCPHDCSRCTFSGQAPVLLRLLLQCLLLLMLLLLRQRRLRAAFPSTSSSTTESPPAKPLCPRPLTLGKLVNEVARRVDLAQSQLVVVLVIQLRWLWPLRRVAGSAFACKSRGRSASVRCGVPPMPGPFPAQNTAPTPLRPAAGYAPR